MGADSFGESNLPRPKDFEWPDISRDGRGEEAEKPPVVMEGVDIQALEDLGALKAPLLTEEGAPILRPNGEPLTVHDATLASMTFGMDIANPPMPEPGE